MTKRAGEFGLSTRGRWAARVLDGKEPMSLPPLDLSWHSGKCLRCSRSVRVRVLAEAMGCSLCDTSALPLPIHLSDYERLLRRFNLVSHPIEAVQPQRNPKSMFDDEWTRCQGLSGLVGSFKQVRWALRIRREVLRKAVREMACRREPSFAQHTVFLIQQESASWWILNRERDFMVPGNLLELPYGEAGLDPLDDVDDLLNELGM